MESDKDKNFEYRSFAEEIAKIEFFKKPEFTNEFSALQRSFDRNNVSILLFGETSSGKTSFANLLISLRQNPDKSYYFQKELLHLLPTCEVENTCFFWVIEASETYFYDVEEDGKLKLRTQNLSELQTLMTEYKKLQKELIPEVKQANLNKEDPKSLRKKFELKFQE